MKLAWTEKLSVGNAFIDSDHQHLISMVNDVVHSIGERDCHIVKLDMQMKPTLQNHDYKFWPGWADGEVNHVAGHVADLYLRISSRK